jgi:hypothetical protein
MTDCPPEDLRVRGELSRVLLTPFARERGDEHLTQSENSKESTAAAIKMMALLMNACVFIG